MGKFEILLRYFLRKIFRKIGYITIREREYDFVFHHLSYNSGLVLDIGCCDSLLALQLAKKGFDVIGIDIREYPFKHKNFIFQKGDISDDSILSNLPKFDYITCVSTLEHIGIGFYGDDVKTDGDKLALLNMYKLLKINGLLILTVPFSFNHIIDNFERIYDYQSITDLFDKNWSILEERYHMPLSKKKWVIVERKQAEKRYKAYIKSNSACYVLQKKR